MKVASSSSSCRILYSFLLVYFVLIEFSFAGGQLDEVTRWGPLEFWMTELPSTLRERPINHLAIPGSHETMTYSIDALNGPGPEQSLATRILLAHIWFVYLPFAKQWAVTQNVDILEQLAHGIRYFDMRMGTRIWRDTIYFVHGIYGAASEEPLQAMRKWLDSHPREIVIIDFQHFYEFNDDDHRRFIAQIKSIFGHKLCPFGDLGKMTLNWFAENKYQVIVIYGNWKFVHSEDLLWPRYFWPTNWPETTDPKIMVERLDSGLENRRADKGFISQCVLTPDSDFVKDHLFRDLEGFVQENLWTVIRWIKNKNTLPNGINVVITDFVELEDYIFSKVVIELNYDSLPELPDCA